MKLPNILWGVHSQNHPELIYFWMIPVDLEVRFRDTQTQPFYSCQKHVSSPRVHVKSSTLGVVKKVKDSHGMFWSWSLCWKVMLKAPFYAVLLDIGAITGQNWSVFASWAVDTYNRIILEHPHKETPVTNSGTPSVSTKLILRDIPPLFEG